MFAHAYIYIYIHVHLIQFWQPMHSIWFAHRVNTYIYMYTHIYMYAYYMYIFIPVLTADAFNPICTLG